MEALQTEFQSESQIQNMESAYYSMIGNAMRVVSQDQYRSNMCNFNDYLIQLKIQLALENPDRNKLTLCFVEMAMAINVFNQDVMLSKGALNWLFAEIYRGNFDLLSSLILYSDNDMIIQ